MDMGTGTSVEFDGNQRGWDFEMEEKDRGNTRGRALSWPYIVKRRSHGISKGKGA
jgi:hypothetical protein